MYGLLLLTTWAGRISLWSSYPIKKLGRAEEEEEEEEEGFLMSVRMRCVDMDCVAKDNNKGKQLDYVIFSKDAGHLSETH